MGAAKSVATLPDTVNKALEVENLTVTLPPDAERRLAVDDVSFSVARNEILCLLGESGSGKSIIALAIMGLLPRPVVNVRSGRIGLNGQDLLALSPRRMRQMRGQQVSMVFQEPMTALNPLLPVGDQISEVLRTHTKLRKKERRDRVLTLMDDMQLPDCERLYAAYPHQLSGGQQQRVMIASALALEPALLIADEPTTALDVTTQARILSLIRKVCVDYNAAVLLITHDVGVAAEVGDRVAVLRYGRVVESGPTRSVLESPAQDYTRMLMASVPRFQPRTGNQPHHYRLLIEARDISKTYVGRSLSAKGRQVQALRDASLQVYEGEIVGLVGESGCGKSTLARIIANLEQSDHGEIRFRGEETKALIARDNRAFRKGLQIVFQDPYRSLNPRRSIGQSIVEGPLNMGVSSQEAWEGARAILEDVGIDARAVTRFPHEFSGGQRQRICIARALAMQPALLIADEIVSALDVSVQAQILNFLREIRDRSDLGVLFVTHDLRVAAEICSRIAVMRSGEIVEMQETQSLFESPQQDYTRSLLNAVPGKALLEGTAIELVDQTDRPASCAKAD